MRLAALEFLECRPFVAAHSGVTAMHWTHGIPILVPVSMLLFTSAGCSRSVDLSRQAPQAAEAVKAALPDATLVETTPERKGWLTLYEAHLAQDQRETSITVSAEGRIIEVETTV